MACDGGTEVQTREVLPDKLSVANQRSGWTGILEMLAGARAVRR
jgi:hypothetical protein